MKKILVLFITSILFSCNSNKENLNEKLALYKQSYQDKDFVKMSTLVHPKIIERIGGTEIFVEAMNNLPAMFSEVGMQVDLSKMEFGDFGEIYENENFLAYIVPTKQPFKIGDDEGMIEASLICISEDKGQMWYFINGDDKGRSVIAEIYPEFIQNTTIPSSRTTINGMIYSEETGEWIQKE